MAMSGIAPTNNRPVCDIQSREQGGRAMSESVMIHSLDKPQSYGQKRLAALQRLHQAFSKSRSGGFRYSPAMS